MTCDHCSAPISLADYDLHAKDAEITEKHYLSVKVKCTCGEWVEAKITVKETRNG